MNIDDDAASESSIGPPPDFSLSSLLQIIEPFVELYDDSKRGLQSKADQFQRLARKVENVIQKTRNLQIAGITGAVVGLVLIPFTVGFSWSTVAGAAATVATVGSVVYVTAELRRVINEKTDKETLLKVGQEFQSEVEPLLSRILEIQKYMANLQKCADIASLLCSTKDKARITISDAEKYGTILDCMDELYMVSHCLFREFRTEFGVFEAIFEVINNITQPNRNLSGEFLEAVDKCASLCKNTIDNLGSMKSECDELSLLLRP